MIPTGTVRTHGLVWHIARSSLHAVVHTHLAHGTERLVIESRHAQRRAQLFIETSQIFQMRCQRGNFDTFIRQMKLLVARIP